MNCAILGWALCFCSAASCESILAESDTRGADRPPEDHRDTKAKPDSRVRIAGRSPAEILKLLNARLEEGLDPSQMRAYERVFDSLDANRDGKHSKAEYIDNGRYLSPQARRGIFAAADGDRDGFVTKAEYVLNRVITDEAKDIVQAMDADGNGSVSKAEFLKGAEIKDKKLAEQLYSALDTDGDQKLAIPEYLRVWGRWARDQRPSAGVRIAAVRARWRRSSLETQPRLKLVDSNASAATRSLYQRLHDQVGRGVLFGQQDATAYGIGWSAEPGRCDVKDVCGAYPAVYGWDLGDIHRERNLDGVSFRAMKRWIREADARGGVNTISMHLDNPVTQKDAWDSTPAVRQVLPGGTVHADYLKTLDLIAAFLKDLRREDGTQIPIVFRPYHEHNKAWSWWGRTSCSREDFISLWRMTAQHLRDTRGVHNLLYAISPQDVVDEASYMERYPGDEYVDILGLDYYGLRRRRDVPKLGKSLSLVRGLAERRGKISALTETGIDKIPVSDWWTTCLLAALKYDERSRKTVWALVWRNKSRGHHFGPFPGHPSATDFVKFYEDTLTIFRKTH